MFTFQAWPCGDQRPQHPLYRHVVDGKIFYPFSQAVQVARAVRDHGIALKDERDAMSNMGLLHGPGGHKAVLVYYTYVGDNIEKGMELAQPVRAIPGCTPAMDATHPSTYLDLQRSLEPFTPPGLW